MGRAQNDLSINRGVAQHPLSDPQRGWRADPLLFPGLGYWWLCLELEGIDPDRKTYDNYGVFSGLAFAPSPPPVPAALALLGLVSLPGAP